MEYNSTSFTINSKFTLSLNDLLNDKSNLSLFLSNIFIIFLAVYYKWDFAEMLWIYWSQSIIIGIFQIIKIIDVKNYSTTGLTFNLTIKNPFLVKLYLILFFIINYGIFHWVYYFFIRYAFKLEIVDYYPIIISCIIFLINHLYSFLSNRISDREKWKNLGQMVNLAYIRIYPMHFTLIFSGFISQYLLDNRKYQLIIIIFFLLIKAITDSISHKYEHNIGEMRDQI